MTQNEFDMIRAIIKSAYPNHNIMPDVYSIKLWYRMLGDLHYKVVETALLELISTSPFPPQIADIRAKCAEYTTLPVPDEGQAWEEVQTAIRRYGQYRAEEALASMSDPVRQAVNRLGFLELCTDENQVAMRAHFFKVYNAITNRMKNDSALPASVLEQKGQFMAALEDISQHMAIENKQEEVPNDDRATPEYIDMLLKKHGLKR